jgi:hypothetical protein
VLPDRAFLHSCSGEVVEARLFPPENPPLELQESVFQRRSRGKTPECAVPAENAVAGKQQEQRFSAHRGANGPVCGGCADS